MAHILWTELHLILNKIVITTLVATGTQAIFHIRTCQITFAGSPSFFLFLNLFSSQPLKVVLTSFFVSALVGWAFLVRWRRFVAASRMSTSKLSESKTLVLLNLLTSINLMMKGGIASILRFGTVLLVP